MLSAELGSRWNNFGMNDFGIEPTAYGSRSGALIIALLGQYGIFFSNTQGQLTFFSFEFLCVSVFMGNMVMLLEGMVARRTGPAYKIYGEYLPL